MSNILFVTWDGGGNVAPAVLIAKELQQRGDTIRFLGQSQQREALESAGFAFTAYSKKHLWTATGKRGAFKNTLGFLGLLVGRSLGRDMLADLATTPTDLVVIDCLLYGALDAAKNAGLRHALLVHSLYAAIETKMAGGAPGAIARMVGLSPRPLWANADATIVTTLEELDPGRTASGIQLNYTGPVIAEVTSHRTTAELPSILVSLSTTYIAGQAKLLQKIMDATADLPVHVIVTTGPAVNPTELHPARNAEVHAFRPHVDVMPTVSLVVGHGGHSTTMLALAHNLPLVILPLNPEFDQPMIAEVVQESGAGLALSSSSSANAIREAIERMLGAGAHRQVAERLGTAIRATHGAATAADLVQRSIANAAHV